MTSSPLSVVVLASGAGPALAATLNGIARQTVVPREVVVVVAADSTSPPPLVHVMDGVAAIAVQTHSHLPGAMRNEGVRRTAGDFVCWLDEGDVPSPRLLELTLASIRQTSADFVAALSSIGDANESPTVVVPTIDLADVLTTSDRLPIGAVLSRAAWNHAGGFDETLAALEEYDLWIRVLQRGSRGTLLSEILVRRPLQTVSRAGLSLSADTVDQAAAVVAKRHQALFARDPTAALISRVRDRAHIDSRYTAFIEQRDRLIAELNANLHEIQALEGFLHEQAADTVDWGDLRAVWPVSHDWGYDRGTPVDRVYIERFVQECAHDIRGRVLEVQESDLTRKFGSGHVERMDVIDINTGNAGATIVADLRRAANVPSDTFDCFILTQTLHVIDDMPAVLREAHRILKPGGVLLATLPCASRVCLEYGPAGDFWRVTEAGARTLFEQVFAPDQVQTRAYGNVLSNVAFLLGLASHEVSSEELSSFDPYFPMLIGVRAVKPASQAPSVIVRTTTPLDEACPVLLYHRVAEPDSDIHGLAVPRRAFRQQMEFLKAAQHVMPLNELLEASERGALPSGAVAITFDDGYRDNLENAAPVLVELGLPATFFLTTQAFEGFTEYWWDALERALLIPERLPETLEVPLNGESVAFAVRTRAERVAAHDRIHAELVMASLAARSECVAGIVRWSGVVDRSSLAPILSAHEVQQLARLPGCSIGAHTVHHLALARQPADVVGRELRESRRHLEHLVGRPVTSVAYPYGNYNAAIMDLARVEGFDVGLTCDARAVRPADDRLAIPRVEVKNWGVIELRQRLTSIRDSHRSR